MASLAGYRRGLREREYPEGLPIRISDREVIGNHLSIV